MANTYTSNVQLAMPATGDRTWNVPVNANAETLDALAPVALSQSSRPRYHRRRSMFTWPRATT